MLLFWQGGFLSNWAGCIGDNNPIDSLLHFAPLTFTTVILSIYVCEKLLSHQLRYTDISLFMSVHVSVQAVSGSRVSGHT